MEKRRRILSRFRLPDVSDAYVKDVAMLAALVLLVLHLWLDSRRLLHGAMAALLLAVVWPAFYRPFSRLWLAGSRVLGAGMSKVILLIVFFALLTPLARLVRLFRHDPLRLRQFKKARASVFVNRHFEFRAADLKKPY